MEINQIRGRLLIVANEIAHQDIEHVIVDGNGLFKTGHKGVEALREKLAAIPINGPAFARGYGGQAAQYRLYS